MRLCLQQEYFASRYLLCTAPLLLSYLLVLDQFHVDLVNVFRRLVKLSVECLKPLTERANTLNKRSGHRELPTQS